MTFVGLFGGGVLNEGAIAAEIQMVLTEMSVEQTHTKGEDGYC